MATIQKFKEFLTNTPKVIHTQFGTHSKQAPKVIHTQFGKHSANKKPQKTLKESILAHGVYSDKHHLEDGDAGYARTDGSEGHVASEAQRIHKTHELRSSKTGGTLPVVQSKALEAYGHDSTRINNFLHEKHKSPTHTSQNGEMEKQAGHLDRVFKKNKIKEDTVLYTGLRESPHKLFGKNPQKTSLKGFHPAFTSTTTHYGMALGFAGKSKHDHGDHPMAQALNNVSGHVLKLHVPKGTPGFSMHHHSSFPEEEMLLGRGLRTEIHPTPKIVGRHAVWTAHVVGHEPPPLKASE